MTAQSEYPLLSETRLPGVAFSAMRLVMLHEAQAHDLPVLEDDGARVTLQSLRGTLGFADDVDGITVTVRAADAEWLHVIRDGLIEHLGQSLPDVVRDLRWSGSETSGALPPNFHFATVLSVAPVGGCFLRVRLKAGDLSRFGDDAIHFRVVLPPAGLADVEWPHVAANGSTVWPKGDKALHRPVYTTRHIDHDAGVMDFDVFVHDGGRVTEWARRVTAGDRVAILGPGGGGIPDTDHIHIYADETALPAAARILEALPQHTRGHAVFQTALGAHSVYPVTCPPGVSVTWLDPQTDRGLAELALADITDGRDMFLWFACEKSSVQRVRAAYKDSGRAADQSYIAAYWTAATAVS
ncbi:MAG: siderophore-interacting protein [Marinibacterium sp.]|nr:siderophore-interacting protein [Marinibacterium sp.]